MKPMGKCQGCGKYFEVDYLMDHIENHCINKDVAQKDLGAEEPLQTVEEETLVPDAEADLIIDAGEPIEVSEELLDEPDERP